MHQKPYIFDFEKNNEQFPSLDFISFSIKYYLDKLGKVLTLGAWSSFPLETRKELLHLSISTEEDAMENFEVALLQANLLYNGLPLKNINIDTSILEEINPLPQFIAEQCSNYSITISNEQWQNLSVFLRYTFYKAATGNDGSVLPKILRELNCME